MRLIGGNTPTAMAHKLNAVTFMISGTLLGMLPVFLPELFPSNSFNGGSTRELWQQFGRLGGAYAAGFWGFRPQVPFNATRSRWLPQLKGLHASTRASIRSWQAGRPSLPSLPLQRLARAHG